MARKTNPLYNDVPKAAETPGYKVSPAPHVSDKGMGTATSGKMITAEKVPNKAVKTRVRSGAVGSKIGASVKPNTGTITKVRPKKLMTAQANATAKKFNPPAGSVAKVAKRNTMSAGTTKPIAPMKPVYETPGFKPAKKTSKK